MRKYIDSILNNKRIMIFGMLFLIVVMTCFPLLSHGILGWEDDVKYHLYRIEGVKQALLSGHYPARIYYNFFGGYGYGSPMFYPDIFLVYPAVLRILGLGPVHTYKVFVATVCLLAAISTYYCSVEIIGDWKLSVLNTYLIMLSQFYLANVLNRAGVSEYIAYIFMPFLIAGIYDFFHNTGQKVYYMGIGIGGMLLCHTNITLIGIMITVALFIVGIIIDVRNQKVTERIGQYKKLVFTALLTMLITAFYWLPMLEQLRALNLCYTIPWAHIGDFVQPLYTFFIIKGSFSNIALVGIGIPLLLLLLVRVFSRRPQDVWADVFYFGGILIFLATTKIIPWRIFNNTFLNNIQFTFRFYPYAIFLLTLGCILHFKELQEKKDSKTLFNRVFIVFLVLIIFFAAWEDFYLLKTGFRAQVSNDMPETTYDIGKGKEWLPVQASDSYQEWSSSDGVTVEGQDIKTSRSEDTVTFKVNSEEQQYVCPFTFYIGYKASLKTEDGKTYDLKLQESKDGKVEVVNNAKKAGTVTVKYAGTLIQKVSLILSILVACFVVWLFIRRKKNDKN